MKKILKNKKGFTLIELLAVIVVLAIIMVIATRQINGTIKKSRVDSFLSTYKIIMDATKTCAVQKLNSTNCESTIDYSEDDYDLDISTTNYETYTITLKAKTDGEFDSIDITEYYTDSTIVKKLGTNNTSLMNITLGKTSLKADYIVN